MAIAFRASTTADSGPSGLSGTTFTINKPTGVVDGDYLLMFITHSSSKSLTTLSGWTLLYTVDSIGISKAAVYYKVASGEGASYTWTFSATGTYFVAGLVSYSGVGGIDVSAHGTQATPGSDATLPNAVGSVTTTAPGDMVLACFAVNSPGYIITFTPPSGYTERIDTNNGQARSVTIADQTFVSTGATGDYSFTLSVTLAAGKDTMWATVALKEPDVSPSGVSVSYSSYTRTGPNNTPWTVNFTEAAGYTNYQVRTASSGGGSLVASGTCTASAANSKTIAYNATGLTNGSNTLYIRTGDGGSNWTSDTSFTLLRDDTAPNAPSSISVTPTTVTATKQYSVTGTAADTTSTNANEMGWYVYTGAGATGTLVGSGSYTSSSISTGTLTDSTLSGSGTITRYLRVRDGANNTAETSFTFTYTPSTNYTKSVTGVSGTITGTLANKTLKSLSGISGTLSGILIRSTLKVLSGINGILSGILNNNTLKALSGAISTLTGILTSIRVTFVSVVGTMGTLSATITKKTFKSLSGAVGSLVASLVRVTQKALSGVSGSLSGGIQKTVYLTLNGLSGLVSGSLAAAHIFAQLLSGALGIVSGVISRTTQKSLSGQINSIVGTLAKLVSKLLSGTSGTLSGSLSTQLVKIVNLVGAVGTVSAALTRSTIKTVSGTLNQIVGSLSRGFLKNVSLSGVLNSFSGNVGWYGIVKRAKMKAGEVSTTTVKAGTLAAGTVMKAGSVLVTRLRGGWRNK